MSTSSHQETRKVVLAFMAHPDDAEVACAGTLIRLKEFGWDVHIASVTAGDCGTMTLAPEEIAAVRVREGTKAAESMGATFHCLHEPDGRVVYDRVALQKAIDLFREIAPILVITMPMSDYHADHEVTGQLGRAASFVYAAPNASRLPLLPGSRVPYLYYCDGIGGVDRLGNPIQPTTWIDIANQIEKKTQMLACHQSQRDWLKQHNGVDSFLSMIPRFASLRGRHCGVEYAEAFVQHRGQAHPSDDILTELFPLHRMSD